MSEFMSSLVFGNTINECDDILANLESALCKFQAELGDICLEIIALNEQTNALNKELKLKHAVKKKLGKFIEEITIPPPVIQHIMYTSTTEQSFKDNLIILDKKIHFFNEQNFNDAKSCNDVQQTLSGLKTKAIFKVREYMLRKIQDCRKYLSNFQVPQNSLAKNKFFYQFLLSHERDSAREIQNEYIDTMSRVYHSYFKEYLHRLSRLEYDEKPDENDLMAAEEVQSKSKVSLIFNMKPASMKKKSTVFTLGDRSSVIGPDLEAPLIMPNTTKVESRYPTEALFRSVHFALLDNAIREYHFVQEFFITSGENQTSDIFHTVFEKTLKLFNTYLVDQFKSTYDSIAMMLCLHIIYRYREIAHRKKVFVLDRYWDSTTKFLFPRIEKIIQLQIESVRNYDSSKSATLDTTPHPVIRKYAEYASAMSSINNTYLDERIIALLETLQNEIKNFILRTAAVLVHPKDELIFMVNNYDHILSVFKSSNLKENSNDSEGIASQLNKRTSEIIEELLYPHFGSLICFVKDCEVFLERDDKQSLSNSEAKVGPLIKSFNSDWKGALEDIQKEILSNFSNFENGANIQRAVLDDVVRYYGRFTRLLESAPFATNNCGEELTSLDQLMKEIENFKSSF